MSEAGDPAPFTCNSLKDKAELSDTKTNAEDLEIRPHPLPADQWLDSNILVNAQITETFLERQSLIRFIETDGEYIVSAGRDHEINVWDSLSGHHVRRFSGHGGPVTGLYLHRQKAASPAQRVVVSSSEDGSVRKWSIEQGEETKVFWTGNVITCMGVMDNYGDSLVVTGNSKGLIKVRNLTTGKLYSTVSAHTDPIDALVVNGDFACSAIFEDPTSLKVWKMIHGQIFLFYNIESTTNTEFSCVALWGTSLLLGAVDGQTLQVIDFKTDKKEIVNLGKNGRRVEHIRVWNNLIFSCSSGKKQAILDVHRMNDLQHFGTFSCNMNQACAVAAMKNDSSLKIILGGSALTVLGFQFNSMQEDAKFTTERFIDQEINNLAQNNKKSHYTMKNYIADEKCNESTDSDESSSSAEENTAGEPCKNDIWKLNPIVHPEVTDDNYRTIAKFCDSSLRSKKPDGLPECLKPPVKQATDSDESSSSAEENTAREPCESDIWKSNPLILPEVTGDNYRTKIAEFCDNSLRSKKPDGLPECLKPPVKQVFALNPVTLLSDEQIFKRASQYLEEPRMAIKRLEKILDDNNKIGNIEDKTKTADRPKTCVELIDDIMKKHYNAPEEDFQTEIGACSNQIKGSKDNIITKTQNERPPETKQVSASVLNENNPSREKSENLKISEVENDRMTKTEKRKSIFSRCKKKKSNKNITEKSGHKKCEIM